MHSRLLPPSADAPAVVWCRWAWLTGRQADANAKTVALLRDGVLDRDGDKEVRRALLSAYWEVVDVREAITLERELVSGGRDSLALMGVEHPRWWHHDQWVVALEEWLGSETTLDEAIMRVWSWVDHPAACVRIPTEIWPRMGQVPQSSMAWTDIVARAQTELRQEPKSPFEAFWCPHIKDWCNRWLAWEESACLYRWRLREEQDLTRWTGSAPYAAIAPAGLEVERVVLNKSQPLRDSLYEAVLGLGYWWNQARTTDLAAQWDGIWSSWSSSLNYMAFEVQSNCQTTEWHIGGLTGALRDGYVAQG